MYVILSALLILFVKQGIGELGVKKNVLKKIARIVMFGLTMGYAQNVSLGFGDPTAGIDALLINVWNVT
jgi:hypothetical protein